MAVKYLASKRLIGTSAERTGVQSSGGTETTVSGYTIHTFTSGGTFTADANLTVEYLVIGSGGGGEQGGGGAGAVRHATGYSISSGNHTITVGAKVAGGNVDGNPSSIGSLIVADGGADGNGGTGTNGSGGGGYATTYAGGAGGTYGNDGGSSNANLHGAGGGGAGAVGVAWSGSGTGQGGAGIQNPIVGSTIGELSSGNYYVGGGGGSAGNGHDAAGGLGGGGDGKDWTPTDAMANTGGGAGGSYNAGNAWSGSGVVIIKVPVGTSLGSNLQANSIFSESNTGKDYLWNGTAWVQVA